MSEELACAEKAGRKAGAAIRTLTDHFNVTEKDSSYNLITTADTTSQKIIIEYIKKQFPDDTVLGEEGTDGHPSLDTERLWIIDPIDGTTNFAHHIPHYSTSIAFAQSGVLQCGIVLDVAKNELFSAQKSKGAWCNGKPIRTSTATDLTHAIVATGFYYERGEMMLKTLETMKQLYQSDIRGMRRMGSAALDLCYVACGRYEGYYEYQLSPWDFAAGMLIVEEAGGYCFDIDGIKRGLNSEGMLACTASLVKPFLNKVVWLTSAQRKSAYSLSQNKIH